VYSESIPSYPLLSQALNGYNISVTVPPLKSSGQTIKSSPFLKDSVYHLLSNTAEFTVQNPLLNKAVLINSIFAEALYNTSTVAVVDEPDLSWQIEPGLNESPRIRVDIAYDGIGGDAIKKALGGSLALNTSALINFNIDDLKHVRLNYTASQVHSRIRL
jgi:hypothetical protein